MTNLELVGGVNFKKGCYPGQEIVARMQYLGKLKQRMYRAHVTADRVPQPGDAIYALTLLLAVIQISSVQAGELHLGNEAGPLLHIQSLSHPLPASP